MVYVPLGKNTSKRLPGVVPPLDLINVYCEASETNQVSGFDILTRPCLSRVSTPSGGPCRGVFAHESTYGVLGGVYVALFGALFKGGGGGGGFGTLGALTGGILPVQMAFGDTEALVASGGALQATDGTSLSAVMFPDSQAVISVAYLNGYYVAVPVGQIAEDGARYLYYSDPTLTPADTGFFTQLRRVGAVMTGGPILRVEQVGTELRVFKTDGIEVFQPTGLDDADDPPFQRIDGRAYDRGTYQPYTVARVKETLVYVDSEGDVNIMGVQPITLSTPYVSQRVAAALSSGTLFGWSFNLDTHEFYVLALPTTTLVCDVSLSPVQWYEWTDQAGGTWRAIFGATSAEGMTYVGDRTSGDVWTLTEGAAIDQGAVTMRQRASGLLPLNSRQLLTSVSLDCAVGAGGTPQPQIELFTSTDQGQTFDSHGVESLGALGATLERMRWTRLGQFEPPMAMIAVESQNPVRWRLSNMRANDVF